MGSPREGGISMRRMGLVRGRVRVRALVCCVIPVCVVRAWMAVLGLVSALRLEKVCSALTWSGETKGFSMM